VALAKADPSTRRQLDPSSRFVTIHPRDNRRTTTKNVHSNLAYRRRQCLVFWRGKDCPPCTCCACWKSPSPTRSSPSPVHQRNHSCLERIFCVFYFSIKHVFMFNKIMSIFFILKTFIIYWLGPKNHRITLICELVFFSLDSEWTNNVILSRPTPDNSVCFVSSIPGVKMIPFASS